MVTKKIGQRHSEMTRRQFLTNVGATGIALGLASPFAALPTWAEQKPGDKVNWQQEWERTKSEARKEGKLVIYTALKPMARKAITENMKSKFGIEVETVFGRGGDLPPRIRTERRAGLYLADIGLMGFPMLYMLKDLNLAPSLEPLLILPEVKDPSKWVWGKLPWMDDEKQSIAPVLSGTPSYFRNTAKVGANDITSSLDLLKPIWKQKIIMFDPGSTGNSSSWFTRMHASTFGMAEGKKFMERLIKQEPLVLRNDRIIVESVARGKYLLGIGVSPSTVGEFIKMGAAVNFIDIKKEPRWISAGAALLNGFTNPPHPNAQKLFVNWLLSKEGVEALSRSAEFAPARVDLSGDWVDPTILPRPGDELTTRERELLKIKMLKVAREMFGSLMK